MTPLTIPQILSAHIPSSVLVHNIPQRASQEAIHSFFEKCGSVLQIRFSNTYREAVEAVVIFSSETGAHEARGRSGCLFMGNIIRLELLSKNDAQHNEALLKRFTNLELSSQGPLSRKRNPEIEESLKKLDPFRLSYLPRTVYVGNVPPNVREDDIIRLSLCYGPVCQFRLGGNNLGEHRYAFIEYLTDEATNMAFKYGNDMTFFGRKIQFKTSNRPIIKHIPDQNIKEDQPLESAILNLKYKLINYCDENNIEVTQEDRDVYAAEKNALEESLKDPKKYRSRFSRGTSFPRGNSSNPNRRQQNYRDRSQGGRPYRNDRGPRRTPQRPQREQFETRPHPNERHFDNYRGGPHTTMEPRVRPDDRHHDMYRPPYENYRQPPGRSDMPPRRSPQPVFAEGARHYRPESYPPPPRAQHHPEQYEYRGHQPHAQPRHAEQGHHPDSYPPPQPDRYGAPPPQPVVNEPAPQHNKPHYDDRYEYMPQTQMPSDRSPNAPPHHSYDQHTAQQPDYYISNDRSTPQEYAPHSMNTTPPSYPEQQYNDSMRKRPRDPYEDQPVQYTDQYNKRRRTRY